MIFVISVLTRARVQVWANLGETVVGEVKIEFKVDVSKTKRDSETGQNYFEIFYKIFRKSSIICIRVNIIGSPEAIKGRFFRESSLRIEQWSSKRLVGLNNTQWDTPCRVKKAPFCWQCAPKSTYVQLELLRTIHDLRGWTDLDLGGKDWCWPLPNKTHTIWSCSTR